MRSVLLDRLRWVVEAEDRGGTRTLLHAVGDSLKNWAKSASKAYAANAGSYLFNSACVIVLWRSDISANPKEMLGAKNRLSAHRN